jgi:predicted permease
MQNNLKPSVNKKYLILISGIMWSGVGILLNYIASKWLNGFEQWQIVFTYFVGIIMGSIIAWFGFRKLARKNSNRIMEYPEKVCIFAFQRWQMYILVVIMMSMGFFMRTTNFIPKYLLAPVYVGIGLALFFGSFVYYKSLFDKKNTNSKGVC